MFTARGIRPGAKKSHFEATKGTEKNEKLLMENAKCKMAATFVKRQF